MNGHEQIIKDAQYRKGLSIAFFNATNAAVEMAKRIPVGTPDEYVIDQIRKWRKMLLEEHAEYYANVIARVGTNYDAGESIALLEACSTMDDLKHAWQSFSEDERQDDAIVKTKEAMKAKLSKPKKNEKA